MTDLKNWTTRLRPERVTLEGQYSRLEPLDAARHGDALFAASMSPGAEARFHYLFEGAGSRAEFDAWLAKASQSPDPLFFGAIDKATGRTEGRQALMRIDPAFGVIEIGNILWGPAIAGGRAATEALFLFAQYAFDTLGYRRFEWKCNNHNEPSKSAALRFGFSFEGLFRQHMIVKGLNRDTAWFSIIDAEWPQLKSCYAKWLAAENFNAAGNQRTKLSALTQRKLVIGTETLRRAGPADLGALLDLQKAAYAPNRAILGVTPIPLQWDYNALFKTHEIWLAESHGKLNGALMLLPRAGDLYLDSVSTAPHTQGSGLGNLLLEATEYRARDWGFNAVRLLTGEKLTRNVEWYKRKGYVIEDIEQVEDRRVVNMMKRLG